MKNSAIVLMLLVLCASSASAQYTAALDSIPVHEYTFSQFGSETWEFVKQPTVWEVSDWITLGVIGLGTYGVMETADEPIRDAVLRNQQSSNSAPMEIGRYWGELYTPVVLFSGIAVYSLAADDKKARKIAYEIGQASLYAGVLTYALKYSFGRARPYMEEGSTSFHPFNSITGKDYQSLPGGHNVAAFVLSTVLSRNVRPLWLKILMYLPAALTFVSRVYQDQHWTSDDVAGAALGYFIATWVVDQHEGGGPSVGMTPMQQLSFGFAF